MWGRRWRTGGGRGGGGGGGGEWKSLRGVLREGERWDGQWVCCSGHCPPVSPETGKRERERESKDRGRVDSQR